MKKSSESGLTRQKLRSRTPEEWSELIGSATNCLHERGKIASIVAWDYGIRILYPYHGREPPEPRTCELLRGVGYHPDDAARRSVNYVERERKRRANG